MVDDHFRHDAPLQPIDRCRTNLPSSRWFGKAVRIAPLADGSAKPHESSLSLWERGGGEGTWERGEGEGVGDGRVRVAAGESMAMEIRESFMRRIGAGRNFPSPASAGEGEGVRAELC